MTAVPAKDRPKLIGLAIGCVLMLLFVIMRVKSAMGGSGNVSQPGTVAGTTAKSFVVKPGETVTAPPESLASPVAAIPVSMPAEVERVDLPPTAYGGPDPFREVLPEPTKDVPVAPKSSSRPRPVPIDPMPSLPGAVPGDLSGPVGSLPAGGPVAPAVPVMPPAPDFRFAGVVGGATPLAVVEVGEKSFFVRVGERLPEDWVVESVTADWLVIRKGAFRKRLRMPMDEEPTSA